MLHCHYLILCCSTAKQLLDSGGGRGGGKSGLNLPLVKYENLAIIATWSQDWMRHWSFMVNI